VSGSRYTGGFLALLWLGAIAAAGQSLVGVPPGPIAIDAALIAHVSGLLAGYLVAVMVVLAPSRIRPTSPSPRRVAFSATDEQE
jgi:hypothetical protein